jgi:serine kinase of HPr protein (carbohydrate metabolism regulator)
MTGATLHGSAVQVGGIAVLIRGPSGSGKSRLAFDLICAGRSGVIAPTRLIGDDRLHLALRDGRPWVSAAPALAGLIEIRGLGIRRIDAVPDGAPVGLVVDLGAADAGRLPEATTLAVDLMGIEIPRVPVAPAADPARLVVAVLLTGPGPGGGPEVAA